MADLVAVTAELRAKGDAAVEKWREADDARDVAHRQYWAGYQAATFEAVKLLETSSREESGRPSDVAGRT